MPIVRRIPFLNQQVVTMLSQDKDTNNLMAFAFLCLLAIIGRLLKSGEKINPLVFIGELFVSIALCGAAWFFGLTSGMDFGQVVLLGVGTGLGYIQIFKFAFQNVGKRG